VSAQPFLSARPAGRATPRSPLARALAGAPEGIADLSLSVAAFEVRGELGSEAGLLRLTPTRGLVVVDSTDAEEVEAALRARYASVLDRSGALAALRIERPDAVTLMRRLTDLDLDALPAVGAVARVRTVVRRAGDRFDLFFPQEYGHYLAGVVGDTAAGL
jgi:hypothetical protein